MDTFIVGIGLLFLILVIICYIIKLFHQPIILGYVLSGLAFSVILARFSFPNDSLMILSELGVTFLLFLIGLEFSYENFKFMGKDILIATLLQSIIFFVVPFVVSFLFGFSVIESVYLSVLFMFSSTLLVAKWLEDKQDSQTLYGRIVFGILVLQDIIAIIFFVILGVLGVENTSKIMVLPIGAIVLLAIAMLFSKYILNRLIKSTLRYPELTFIFGLGVCFFFVEVSILFGFSETIGAFLGGVVLANTIYQNDVSSRLKPLIIFFNMLFFVGLGLKLEFDLPARYFLFMGLFLVMCIIIKPIVVYLTLKGRGFDSKTCAKASVSLAQFSEFGVIIVTTGIASQAILPDMGTISITLLIITMVISSYSIKYNEILSTLMYRRLQFLDKYFLKEKKPTEAVDLSKYDIIVIGYLGLNKELLTKFESAGSKILVIENDPVNVQLLRNAGINFIYNSVTNLYFFEHLKFERIKLLISNLVDVQDNIMILKKLKEENPLSHSILSAKNLKDSLMLYDAGADYVICSTEIKENQVSMLLQDYSQDINKLIEKKIPEITRLKEKKNTREAVQYYEWDDFVKKMFRRNKGLEGTENL
ncbi:MAG TPA: cation:proton antiporter [Candidatus Nanoarchaeia archaeon]|nr:cation:proton antiporter [Candidatus Nanoarchaeia archaeon]